MNVIREDDGTYRLEVGSVEQAKRVKLPTDYADAFVRYLTILDPVFEKAKLRSEFDFIMALLRVRGIEDAGWDPYETSVAAMRAMQRLAAGVADFPSQRHLHLWTYGHLIEASEPYEIVRNLLGISLGESWNPWCYPPENDRPVTPGAKIKRIEAFAASAGMADAVVPLRERWDRDLRNAIFHADYALHGDEVRIRRPMRVYSNSEFLLLLNRAKACHDAITFLQDVHRKKYDKPRLVAVPPSFSRDPEALGQVIIRNGEGVAAMRAAWASPARPGEGERIVWSFGRFYPGEAELLEADPTLLILPRPAWDKPGRPDQWCPE